MTIPTNTPIILSDDATVMVGGMRYMRFLLKRYGRSITMREVAQKERARLTELREVGQRIEALQQELRDEKGGA